MGIGNELVAILCGILLVSLVQVVTLYLSLKRKREEMALINRLEELMRLQNELKQNNVEILRLRVEDDRDEASSSEIRNEIIELYKKKLLLCKADFGKTRAFGLLSQIRFTPDMQCSENDRKMLLEAISKSFVEIIQDLYVEIPDVKTTDINTCILSYLGCDNEAIANIECVSSAAIRQRKSRLGKKAPADVLELFVTN